MTAVWIRNAYGLQVRKKFKDHLRKLTDQERQGLEQSIVEFGVRDPIVAWKKTSEILDGHNRWEIAEAKGLTYQVVFLELADENACLAWIAKNQRARRNLTPLELEQEAKRVIESLGGPQMAGGTSEPVYQKAAEITGQNVHTTRMRYDRATQADKLIPPLKKQYDSGALVLNKKTLRKLSQLPAPEQAAIHESVKSGDYKTHSEAVAARFGEESSQKSTPEPDVQEAGFSEEPTPQQTSAPDKVFEKAIDALGVLVRAVDDIGRRVPNYSDFYDKARARLSDIKDILDRWGDVHNGAEF